jgi:hypothetical protein
MTLFWVLASGARMTVGEAVRGFAGDTPEATRMHIYGETG